MCVVFVFVLNRCCLFGRLTQAGFCGGRILRWPVLGVLRAIVRAGVFELYRFFLLLFVLFVQFFACGCCVRERGSRRAWFRGACK